MLQGLQERSHSNANFIKKFGLKNGFHMNIAN